VLEEGGDWGRYLPSVEFTYNNSFHSSIGMAPYEALYGRKCRSSICWFKTGEKLLLGPELIQETTNGIKRIKEMLKRAQDRMKSYADQRRKPLEFGVGEHVFLNVTPYTAIEKAMKTKKLQPRFIGPFQILRRVGPHCLPISFAYSIVQSTRCISRIIAPNVRHRSLSHFRSRQHSVEVKYLLSGGTREDLEKTLWNKVMPLVKIL
jgi:hypothetical protein